MRVLPVLVLLAASTISLAAADAQQLEEPPSKSARSLLGSSANGSNYQIDDVVQSDGFLYIFTLNSKYGKFRIEGLELLKARLLELRALDALEHTYKTQAFTDAAAKSAASPLKFAAGLIFNPVGTVNDSLSGVGALFQQSASAAANVGHNPDSSAASALGISAAKRRIANRLGVDPYTDFKPLAAALDEMAGITAFGGLVVSGAFTAVTGPAGMALSFGKSAESVGQAVNDKTPTGLRDTNRAMLARMGISPALTSAFLDNVLYTPLDQTIIVAALAQMSGAKNKNLFIQRTSQVRTRELAYFLRRRAELLADYNRRSEPITEFIEVRGIPLNRTQSGRVLMMAPLDALASTRTVNQWLAVFDEDLKQRKLGKVVEIRITGTATELVRRHIEGRGWKLVENVAK